GAERVVVGELEATVVRVDVVVVPRHVEVGVVVLLDGLARQHVDVGLVIQGQPPTTTWARALKRSRTSRSRGEPPTMRSRARPSSRANVNAGAASGSVGGKSSRNVRWTVSRNFSVVRLTAARSVLSVRAATRISSQAENTRPEIMCHRRSIVARARSAPGAAADAAPSSRA